MGRATERIPTKWNPLQIPEYVRVLEDSLKTRVDKVSSSLTYHGQAVRGTATSAAGWFITRITKSGTVTSIDLASSGFDQVWDDRASLTYN